MSFTDARTYLDIPAPVVNQNGFLFNANVVPAGAHDLMGAEYQTNACADGETWADLCYNEPLGGTAPAGGVKQFGQPELVQGSPFAAYDGVQCSLQDMAEGQAQAEERLSFSEGRQVDYNVLAALDAMVGTDLGPQTLAAACALFEDYSSVLYGSYGVLSVPRSLVCVGRSQHIFFDAPDGGLQTATGTQVIAVAQETPGGATPVYLSGRITLIQGAVISRAAPSVTLPDGSTEPQRALAERMYVPLVECMVVKATATAT